ncbi:hypothetical protein BN903_25 [Halorubrum sp. AJ67]|nr:hypothetical protein BN903_25 [Halorubrum sp. AJ67]
MIERFDCSKIKEQRQRKQRSLLVTNKAWAGETVAVSRWDDRRVSH